MMWSRKWAICPHGLRSPRLRRSTAVGCVRAQKLCATSSAPADCGGAGVRVCIWAPEHAEQDVRGHSSSGHTDRWRRRRRQDAGSRVLVRPGCTSTNTCPSTAGPTSPNGPPARPGRRRRRRVYILCRGRPASRATAAQPWLAAMQSSDGFTHGCTGAAAASDVRASRPEGGQRVDDVRVGPHLGRRISVAPAARHYFAIRNWVYGLLRYNLYLTNH